MSSFRIVALGEDVADGVRTSLRAPRYGHPAHVEVARGYGPCRVCLERFAEGAEERVLFTHNPFPSPAIPAPGPVVIHKESCRRYEGTRLPAGLRGIPMVVEGHDETGMTVARRGVGADPDTDVEEVLARGDVAYAHIRNAEVGCFIARIERE